MTLEFDPTIQTDNRSPHDPGAHAAAARAARVQHRASDPVQLRGGHEIRIGTAGWTDRTLLTPGLFYPPGVDTPEDRLKYYAAVFSLVEVDSTYYTLPTRRNSELWIERTAAGFVFDMKAHALMTGQPTEVKRLPRPVREALPAELAEKNRIYGSDLPAELCDEVWRFFHDAVTPLQEAGRMGSVLLQYPRWFFPSGQNRDLILLTRERLKPLDSAVEFRNAAWFNEKNADRTLRFLEENQIPFVMVDEPQGTQASVPPLLEVSSPELAIVRFHGRKAETWDKRNVGVEDRFRYLYSAAELQEWAPKTEEIAQKARQVHIIMNNCYANYGTTNALEFAELLKKQVETP